MTKKRHEEMQQCIRGLSQYAQKGVRVFVDGEPSGSSDWERLFEAREDGLFYMGDYVQNEAGELKEIRFDKVYLCEKGKKQS
ncbi:MAG: hypothetical protein HFE84_02345 [Lachnospiraceae bacterium]|jgi:hypothetical protein|nr:hypothetical protein [Lachnospiraceae bacterium]